MKKKEEQNIVEIKDKKDIWCGLDISTSTIGCSIIINDGSEYGQLVTMTHVKPKVSKKITKDKDKALFYKVEIFREQFLKKYKGLGITRVIIEEPLINSNNSVTCSTLLRFNGMLSYCIFQEWGIIPDYISSYDARKYSFPELMSIRKYNKEGNIYPKTKILSNIKKSNLVLFGNFAWDIIKKEILRQKVAEIFPQIEWLYDKKGELLNENHDSSDAYIALLGQLNRERNGELNPKITNIKDTKKKCTYTIEYWNKKIESETYYA